MGVTRIFTSSRRFVPANFPGGYSAYIRVCCCRAREFFQLQCWLVVAGSSSIRLQPPKVTAWLQFARYYFNVRLSARHIFFMDARGTIISARCTRITLIFLDLTASLIRGRG